MAAHLQATSKPCFQEGSHTKLALRLRGFQEACNKFKKVAKISFLPLHSWNLFASHPASLGFLANDNLVPAFNSSIVNDTAHST